MRFGQTCPCPALAGLTGKSGRGKVPTTAIRASCRTRKPASWPSRVFVFQLPVKGEQAGLRHDRSPPCRASRPCDRRYALISPAWANHPRRPCKRNKGIGSRPVAWARRRAAGVVKPSNRDRSFAGTRPPYVLATQAAERSSRSGVGSVMCVPVTSGSHQTLFFAERICIQQKYPLTGDFRWRSYG